MVENLAEALDDRKAEAEAPRHPGALVEPPELLEHHALPVGGNAEARIPDLDPKRAGRRQPTSTLPFSVYLMALETRFCRSRRISRRSVRIASLDDTNRSSSPFERPAA